MKMSPKAKTALKIIFALYGIFLVVFFYQVWKYHGRRTLDQIDPANDTYWLKDDLELEAADKPPLHYPANTLIDRERLETMKEYGVESIKVEGYGPIIGVNATAVFIWLNFGIVIVALYGFLWEPITRVLDERASHVKGTLDDVAQQKKKAQEILDAYKAHLQELEEKREQFISGGQKEGQEERQKMIRRAKEEIRMMHDKAIAQIDDEISRARDELKKEIADLSVALARRILEREISDAEHGKLIEDFIKELESTDEIKA
jgi:F-type H+-transporting ATPase subunit b